MPDEQRKVDPQDRQFGAAAARDQDRVDSLEERGADDEDMPEQPASRPRAAGKAEPEGSE